eukprot:gene3729-biopygen36203
MRSELLPGAGDFLETVPSRVNRLSFRPSAFVIELQTRLLCDIFPQGLGCPLCAAPMDRRGYHCMLCSCGGDRTTRHNILRGTFAHDLTGAGLHPEVEAPHLLLPDPDHPGQDARRPADVYLAAFVHRRPTAFDFAVTSPHRRDVQRRAADEGGLAAADYEGFKRTFGDTADECARDGVTFVPMIFEPSGGCGPSAREVFHRLARGGSAGADIEPAVFALQHRQKWSVLVRQLHARAVLRRLHDSVPVADPCALSPAQEAAEAAAAARESSWLAAQRTAAVAPAVAGSAACAPGMGSEGCVHAGMAASRASVPRLSVAAPPPGVPASAAVPAAAYVAAAAAADGVCAGGLPPPQVEPCVAAPSAPAAAAAAAVPAAAPTSVPAAAGAAVAVAANVVGTGLPLPVVVPAAHHPPPPYRTPRGPGPRPLFVFDGDVATMGGQPPPDPAAAPAAGAPPTAQPTAGRGGGVTVPRAAASSSWPAGAFAPPPARPDDHASPFPFHAFPPLSSAAAAPPAALPYDRGPLGPVAAAFAPPPPSPASFAPAPSPPAQGGPCLPGAGMPIPASSVASS